MKAEFQTLNVKQLLNMGYINLGTQRKQGPWRPFLAATWNFKEEPAWFSPSWQKTPQLGDIQHYSLFLSLSLSIILIYLYFCKAVNITT